MRSNVELKARYSDHERARTILTSLGAKGEGPQQQVDTYFEVRSGRLKLREIEGSESELIFYQRFESAGARRDCSYQIFRHMDTRPLREILTAALGIKVEVVKTRQVFWLEGVKVNLDEVEGLGRFIEFEALADKCGPRVAEARVKDLVRRFDIGAEDIVNCSYSDMLGD